MNNGRGIQLGPDFRSGFLHGIISDNSGVVVMVHKVYSNVLALWRNEQLAVRTYLSYTLFLYE